MGHPYDIAVIGGGIVGLATAWALLQRDPSQRLAVIEKEAALASHQTGRNSGVIHSGIYYQPGSLKATLCREGVQHLIDLCEAESIPYELCGKVIVATRPDEIPALEELYRRGIANGVPGLRRIGPDELKAIEPHVAGVAALYSPQTGIVDYKQVAQALSRRIEAAGGEIKLGAAVHGILQTTGSVGAMNVIQTSQGEVTTRFLVNCAGLHSDRIARMMGLPVDVRIVPFRGEYYLLRAHSHHLVKGLIYPVPDPRFPFLGVHFTRMIDGGVEAGPNAVLAFAREGYTKGTISAKDLAEVLAYPGFRRLARRYWRTGFGEMWRSFSRPAFVKALRRLIPELSPTDVDPGPAGVRAQAVAPDGTLVDDFRIVEGSNAVHVLNAPSPGATASIAIGRYIANRVTAVASSAAASSSVNRALKA